MEIDIAAVDHTGKKLFAGECKFYVGKTVDLGVYADLQKKCRTPELAGYEITYGLFSVSGFDERLHELAKNNPQLYLIDAASVKD